MTHVKGSMRIKRMARNQSEAAAACKTFAEAEEQYRRTDWDGDGILEYAQSLAELYRANLIPKEMADAEGESGQAKDSYRGYCFKVLKGQTKNSAGREGDYVVDGNMIRGYALMAYPADYGATGRDVFIINNHGVLGQGDYGPDTPRKVRESTQYDLDPWIFGCDE
jgi:hypothetical protein